MSKSHIIMTVTLTIVLPSKLQVFYHKCIKNIYSIADINDKTDTLNVTVLIEYVKAQSRVSLCFKKTCIYDGVFIFSGYTQESSWGTLLFQRPPEGCFHHHRAIPFFCLSLPSGINVAAASGYWSFSCCHGRARRATGCTPPPPND